MNPKNLIYNVKSNEKKKLIYTLLFIAYLSLTLIRFMSPSLLSTVSLIVIGIFVLIQLSTKIKKNNFSIYIYIVSLCLSFLISSLFVFRSIEIPRTIFQILANAGIAIILLRGYVYSWGVYIVFYAVAVYFILQIFKGVPPQDVMKYSSWNGISTVMIISCITLYIVLSIEGKNINPLPVILTLLISIWAIGRSGIISCIILFLGILIVKLLLKPKQLLIFISIILLLYILSDQIIKFSDDVLQIGNAIQLYEDRLEDFSSGRDKIWENYYQNLDLYRVIFGVNVVTDPWPEKEQLAYNYHSSFIQFHSKTGLMGIFTMILILFVLLYYIKQNTLYFFLFLALLTRSSTDVVLFFESWDFLPFYFIFYFLLQNKIMSSKFSLKKQI